MRRKTYQGKHLKSAGDKPKHRVYGISARSDAWKSLVDRTMRALLAFSVIVILIPALQLVAPGVIGDLLPWGADEERQTVEAAEAFTDAGAEAPSPSEDPTVESPDHSAHDSDGHDHDPELINVVAPNDEGTAPTSSGTDSTGSSQPSEEAPNSTKPGSSTTHTSEHPPTVDGQITGDACPCTVKGTVELKGDVSLKGDLMVMGGTLVARPGVNVNGNGFQIMFMNGGKADFRGSEVFTWSGRGSKQNLERDIVFKNLRRIMFHEGAGKSTLIFMSVIDSGGPALGDYPIHFHRNGNSTRGTLVEGVVVVNGKHHAFVPHGSHGITFKDTIAKNTKGEAYWWDPADTGCGLRDVSRCTLNNSNDTVFDHALADGVFNGPGDNRGFQLNAFRLGAGSGNKVFDSAAINVRPSHKDVCSGFHWPADANQNVGGNVWLFKNNYGESDCNGIYVWQNDGNHHIIDGFSGGGIEHGAYGNNYDYRNVSVPFLIIHATQWKMSNSSVGRIEVRDHVAAGDVNFTNVTGTKIVMNDNHGEEGARLIFTNTNLTCSDVDWTNAHPESRVVIEGQSC